MVEDQDREKPEEYKGEKEEVKVGGENKLKDSLSRLEETKHDLK